MRQSVVIHAKATNTEADESVPGRLVGGCQMGMPAASITRTSSREYSNLACAKAVEHCSSNSIRSFLAVKRQEVACLVK